jgi:hypothetical protein
MPRRYLLGLALVFGLLALIYSWATPLFEAPDEPWHYAYLRWLAEGHGLPRLDGDSSGANQEVAQPPLYYSIAALASGLSADDDLQKLFWHNPQFGFQAGGTVNDNKNMLIHTDREHFPWDNAVRSVRLARLVSLIFGLVTIGATYGLAREAFPEQAFMAVATAGAVALTPQFLFISGVVSNDSAAAATGTLALWALARIIRLGPTPLRAVGAGLTLGLALLSKTSTLLLLPIAFLALALGWWRKLSPAESQSGDGVSRRLPRLEAVLMLGLAVLIGGWWYLRNWLLFDDPAGLRVHVNTPWGRPEPVGLIDLVPELPQVFRSFWGAFGWGHVELPGSVYVALALLVGLAVLGWFRLLLRAKTWVWNSPHSTEGPGAARRGHRRLSAIAGISLISGLWLFAVCAALMNWMQQVEAPHGRLLFPALGAWGLLLVAGWLGLFVGPVGLAAQSEDGQELAKHAARYLVFLPLIGLGLLSAATPFAVIRPAFAQPDLMTPQQASTQVDPRVLEFDGQIRLLGYHVEPQSVETGERVKVTLCWEALRRIDRDYMLFIHLLGRDNLRVGERTSYPGQGRFPTSLWPTGRAFCDAYWVPVADWAPAPELYALEVGFYEAETGWRLPAQDRAGQAVELPVLGTVRVTPAASPEVPEHLLSYDLGGQIALRGYDSSLDVSEDLGLTSVGAGETVTLTLYWQALQVPEDDFRVFVHLVDETGALVAQDDVSPRKGGYPTWAWHSGDLVADPHQVELPDELPGGRYTWLVGMYQPDTLERLPVVGPEGPVPDDAIPLGLEPE